MGVPKNAPVRQTQYLTQTTKSAGGQKRTPERSRPGDFARFDL